MEERKEEEDLCELILRPYMYLFNQSYWFNVQAFTREGDSYALLFVSEPLWLNVDPLNAWVPPYGTDLLSSPLLHPRWSLL